LSRKNRIRGAFQQFDKNKQGSVSLDQACDIMQGYLGFSEAKAKQTVEVYDKNNESIMRNSWSFSP
jgi:Ca2+-binding EF-hand superfamily protein